MMRFVPRDFRTDPMKTVIILDSEVASTHPMEAVLNRRGFLVIRAGSTDEAIKLLKSTDDPVHLMILEVPLSGSASQTEAAAQIHQPRRIC
jgi:response regulator RpfG family c-di-GMP phosphodiesterase